MFSIGVRRLNGNFLRGVRSYSTKTTESISWVEFFKLRKQASRINMGASVVTASVGAFATLTMLGNIEVDIEKPIFGLDPMMVMGGGVILGGFAGFVMGPSLGSMVFKLKNGSVLSRFKAKDEVFLKHVKANRVDPSSQSFSNPVPDYYGEKIHSLSDYKQWLRDCNAFRRKTKEFIL